MLKPLPPYDGLGKALRSLRLQKKWTLEEAGGEAGVQTANLSRYETGEVYPSFAVLARLLVAYGTDFHGLADALEPGDKPKQPDDTADPFIAAVRGALHRLGYEPKRAEIPDRRNGPRQGRSKQE